MFICTPLVLFSYTVFYFLFGTTAVFLLYLIFFFSFSPLFTYVIITSVFLEQLYQPLNIFIALVGVEVWKDKDLVEISKDGDKTLTNFLNYRKVHLIRDHPNDNAQLLT